MKVKILLVDAFTTEVNKGNRAGVVLDADGLNERQMQKIASIVNVSETAFVFSRDGQDHDIRIRYFTPTTEVPLCGHATIAAHFARAKEKGVTKGCFKQKTKAGILPVQIDSDEEGILITMTQNNPVFGSIITDDTRTGLLLALDLKEEDLNPESPIQIIATGHSKVILGILKREKLNSIHPNFNSLKELSKSINCNGYFVFTFDTPSDDILTAGRMFAPAIGINEDPVTGMANGPLGAYLVKHRLVRFSGNELKFAGLQGEAIGKSGICYVTVHINDNEPVLVQISGRAVIASQLEILLENL